MGAEEKEIDVERPEQARNPLISGLIMRHFWGWARQVAQSPSAKVKLSGEPRDGWLFDYCE